MLEFHLFLCNKVLHPAGVYSDPLRHDAKAILERRERRFLCLTSLHQNKKCEQQWDE